MPTVTVAAQEIFYALSRQGERVVVLIHGAGGSHLHWPAELRRLPGAAVYAVDLPGHGRSTGGGRERIEDYAADLLAWLDRVGVERAVWIGHSMGGAIAQRLALDAPERTAGLVLVGTGARLRVASAILEGIEHDFAAVIDLIAAWAWGPGADPALVDVGRQTTGEAGPQILLGDFLACDCFDVRQEVGQITVPTLAISGSEDRLTPPKFGRWLAEQIPQADFRQIEGAGHMVMLERPAEVASAVSELLNSLPESSGSFREGRQP